MRWALLAAISFAGAARAHDADVIFALVEQRDGALLETVTMTSSSLGLLAPVDADGDGALSQEDLDARAAALRAGVWEDIPLSAGAARCTLGPTTARVREGFVELQARFTCPDGELRQDFRVLRVLPANYRVVLGSQLDGERGARGVAQGTFTTLSIPRPAPPGAWDGAAFLRAFNEGLALALTPASLLCLAALCLALAHWRRGLAGLCALWAGLLLVSFVSVPSWAQLALGVAGLVAFAALKEPHFALAVALGLAVGRAGYSLPSSLGVAAGAAVVWLLAGPALLAIGVVLGRRAKLRRPVRWVLCGAAAIALFTA